MENQSFQKYSWVFAIAAFICWLSIATQLYLTLQTAQLSLIGTIVKFFSYFTILTNIVVALCVSSFALGKGFLDFFKSPVILGAVVVYITIVGIVYNVILRYQWNPEGINRIVDEMLHTVIPTGFVVFWLLAIPKNVGLETYSGLAYISGSLYGLYAHQGTFCKFLSLSLYRCTSIGLYNSPG